MSAHSRKNIIVYFLAVLTVGALFYAYYERDREIMESVSRFGHRSDSAVVMSTEDEKRIAAQFSDSTLPELKRLGLIKSYTRTEIETIITVAGKVWNKRSSFFKKSLLTQLSIYNKVNGYSVTVKILDDETHQLYAQIVPPDRKEIF
ncbi:MAG: hypothetical protein ACYC09_08720 [Bacteroidota bacterium]